MKKIHPAIIFGIGCVALIVVLLILRPSTKQTPAPVSPRVQQFADYLIEEITRETHSSKNDVELQGYIDGWHNHREMMGDNVRGWEAESLYIAYSLPQDAQWIAYIDSIQERQVDFIEASRYVQNMSDTICPGDSIDSPTSRLIMFQRKINRARSCFSRLYLSKKARAYALERK